MMITKAARMHGVVWRIPRRSKIDSRAQSTGSVKGGELRGGFRLFHL